MNKRICIILIGVIIFGLLFNGCSQTQTSTFTTITNTPTTSIMSSKTVFNYLASLGNTGLYTIMCNNIYYNDFETYNSQSWWDMPTNCGYLSLGLYVDKGSATQLLPPNFPPSTIVSSGRQIAWFSWELKPDGTVIPLSQFTQWLDEQLSVSSIATTS